MSRYCPSADCPALRRNGRPAEVAHDAGRCPVCGAFLEGGPADTDRDVAELLPVLSSTDPGLIALARSVLDAAGIRYVVRNERDAQYSLWGMLATLDPASSHAPTIAVEASRADEARELLTGEAEVDLTDLPEDGTDR